MNHGMMGEARMTSTTGNSARAFYGTDIKTLTGWSGLSRLYFAPSWCIAGCSLERVCTDEVIPPSNERIASDAPLSTTHCTGGQSTCESSWKSGTCSQSCMIGDSNGYADCCGSSAHTGDALFASGPVLWFENCFYSSSLLNQNDSVLNASSLQPPSPPAPSPPPPSDLNGSSLTLAVSPNVLPDWSTSCTAAAVSISNQPGFKKDNGVLDCLSISDKASCEVSAQTAYSTQPFQPCVWVFV